MGDHPRQQRETLARIDPADREQPDRFAAARVRSHRHVFEPERRGLGLVDPRALRLVLLTERRAVRERQRVPHHPAERPLFKRHVGAKQQLFHAAIGQMRREGAVVADNQQKRRLLQTLCDPIGKVARGRGHAQVNDVALRDPGAQTGVHRRQHRVELLRPRKVRQWREPDVGGADARPAARRHLEDRHGEEDLVEVRRQRVDVACEGPLGFPQRSVRGLPEGHVVQDAERHARASRASRRS